MTAQALAKRLGRPLAIQWYESKLDAEASSTIEANALLSDGRCNLVAGYPLVKDALGKPGLEKARLPGFAGAQPADRRRLVELGTLTPTMKRSTTVARLVNRLVSYAMEDQLIDAIIDE